MGQQKQLQRLFVILKLVSFKWLGQEGNGQQSASGPHASYEQSSSWSFLMDDSHRGSNSASRVMSRWTSR